MDIESSQASPVAANSSGQGKKGRKGHIFSKIFSSLSLRYISLRRSTVVQGQPRLFSTVSAREMPFKLPTLPDVSGADPTRAVLDSFKIAIAKRVADALPPLTLEQVYQGVDYGKKGVDFTIALPRFRLPAKVDVLAKTVIDQVCPVRCALLHLVNVLL